MSDHNHRTRVDGCYRCELSDDEVGAACPVSGDPTPEDRIGYLLGNRLPMLEGQFSPTERHRPIGKWELTVDDVGGLARMLADAGLDVVVRREDSDTAGLRTLTSSDPEPGLGAIVVDRESVAWKRTPNYGTRFGWSTLVVDPSQDPRSWVRLAGNHGPVVLVAAAAAVPSGDEEDR